MPGGRPPYEPSEKDRVMVKTMSGFGIPDYEIARVLGISPPTMRKYFDLELATGHVEANAKVAQSLFKKTQGDGSGAVVACIFWLKTRAGWREHDRGDEPGKKQIAQAAAEIAGRDSEWGDDLNYTGPRVN